MKIIIGHLFNDLLNLYGENGNILALKSALEQQNIEVEVKNFSLDNEPWDLEALDIVYVGAGTEQNQKLALSTLIKYKDTINQMILNNKFFLCTGNSIELFGKNIINKNEVIDALDVFDYTTERTEKRIVAECVFSYDEITDDILGFENHQGKILGISNPLFIVKQGFGADLQEKQEGFRSNNFFGTYLLGPLLARNPKLLEYICSIIILQKDSNFELKPFDFTLETEAYNKFISKYDKD